MPEEKGYSCASAPNWNSAFPGGRALLPTQDPGPVGIWFQRQSFREDCGTLKMESTQLLEKDLVERVRRQNFRQVKSPPTLFETTERSPTTSLRPGQQSGYWTSLQETSRSVTYSNQEPSVLPTRTPKVVLGVPFRFRKS